MRVVVRHTIDRLERDQREIAAKAPGMFADIVEDQAKSGNTIAKHFASQQHTMRSSIDEPYARSFTAEGRGLSWVYGPTDDGIAHGGQQARGYENGSRNQRPHNNLRRSQDIIAPAMFGDVKATLARLFRT